MDNRAMALKALDQRLAGGAASPVARPANGGPSTSTSRPPVPPNGDVAELGLDTETAKVATAGDEEVR